jgi:hypothetical protein
MFKPSEVLDQPVVAKAKATPDQPAAKAKETPRVAARGGIAEIFGVEKRKNQAKTPPTDEEI